MARKGDGSVSFEHVPGTACKEARYHRRCQGRWRGIVDLGKDEQGRRRTRKVSAATKAEAQAKLETVRIELAKGIRPRAGYTVQAAVDAWFAHGLPGRSAKTLSTYREVTAPVLKLIGGKLLTELTADHVRAALTTTGRTRSSRTVEIAHRCLVRAIDHAQASDLVSRNVAALVRPPQGKAPGRSSKSLTVLQARQLVHSSTESRLYAYIVLCITTGLRTEEARALRWTEVNLAEPSVSVYRSVRARGDVKTPRSRRKLKIPELAAQAIEHQQEQQSKERADAGSRWKEHGLVFTSKTGTPLDASHVRRAFKDVTERAGLGRTGPRGSCAHGSCR